MVKFAHAIISAFLLAAGVAATESYGGGESGYGGGALGGGEGGYGGGESGGEGHGYGLEGGSEGGHEGGYGGGYEGGLGGLSGGGDAGYGGGYGGGLGGYGGGHGGYGGGYGGGHEINAAILSHHSIKSIPVHSSGGHSSPTLVNVDAGVAPIVLQIKSRSSPIIPKHSHIGTRGSFHKSFSSDKPHKMVHVVHKPVIHELKEVILPYRRHTQKVKPVKQSIQTFVHQGNHGHGYGHGYGK